MKKLLLLITFLAHLSGSTAQSSGILIKENKVILNRKPIQWIFQPYGDYIIKTTIRSINEKHGEQISNAVIAQPAMIRPVIKGTKNSKIWLGKNRLITVTDSTVEYATAEAPRIIATHAFFNADYKGVNFLLDKAEELFGAGERALPQNRRGKKLVLYNNPWYGYEYGADNLNFSVPTILSSKGYALFFDNPSKGYFDLGYSNPDILQAGFVSGELSYYIIFGANADEILQRYQQLVGTQPLPPRWALGNFISRFGYRSQQQADAVIKQMKEQQFPADAVILDLFWFGDSIQHTLGNLDWVNKEKWPDPKKMMTDWKQQHLKTIIITEPFILENTLNYKASLKYQAVDSNGKPYTLTDFYFGIGGIVDVFRKDAQEWFKNVYRTQTAKGVNGWWTDLGEPEKHPANLYHNLKDFGFKRLFAADEVHNIFGHYWNKMLFDYYKKEHPATRLFHLNRSGFAGSPRYSIFPWTGDISRNWNGLKAQLPVILGMNLSGIPYTHSDAGGFTTTYTQDPELYTRWLQLAAFTPIFRPHAAALGDLNPPGSLEVPSEPALWDEPTRTIARNLIQLRYNMTPYNYTLAYEQAKYGKLLLRPMFYQNFADSNLLQAESQFMWGDNILVAPVLEKGAVTKTIYFPAGKWYDFVRHKTYTGAQWITDSASLQELPFFVREGGFVPMVSGFKNMDIYTTKDLTILYVPSLQKSSFTMYDDDGETNHTIEKNEFELLHMSGKETATTLEINLTSNGGKFKGQPARRTVHFVIPLLDKIPAAIQLNHKSLPVITNTNTAEPGIGVYDAVKKTLTVSLAFNGKPVQVYVVK